MKIRHIGAVVLWTVGDSIQTLSQEPKFEAVSLKPSDGTEVTLTANGPVTTRRVGLSFHPGRITGTETLLGFIREAYSVKDWQISGPSWLGGDSFAVLATMAEATSNATGRLMLRSMLAERFHTATTFRFMKLCRRWYWQRAVPSRPGDASITATALPSQAFSPCGRETQLIAFFNTPGME
jgi:Protein of unknown function (DUF3738)